MQFVLWICTECPKLKGAEQNYKHRKAMNKARFLLVTIYKHKCKVEMCSMVLKKKEKEKLSKDNILHGSRRGKYITKSNKSPG